MIGLVREKLYVSGKSKEISSEQFADNPVRITILLIAMTIESLSSNKKISSLIMCKLSPKVFPVVYNGLMKSLNIFVHIWNTLSFIG